VKSEDARLLAEADQIDTPPGYSRWSAAKKHAWLWDTLVLGTVPDHPWLPPLVLPFQQRPATEVGVVIRKAQLDKALTRTSDVMEPGRPKFIHARGAVAMVELETDEQSPFTGLLGPPTDGGASGLIRMSMVQKPSGKKSHIPAFGLKLLIDGEPSADLLAMNHTVGQGRDFDMFSNSMTNDLTETHREIRTMQRLMSRLFERVSDEPRRLTVDHLTDHHRDGSVVADPVAPDRLIFRPTVDAKRVFRGKADVDFRRVLAAVDAGVPLYSVHGVVGPRSDRAIIPVGVVRTTTRFVSSPGGDRLFFRHVQDDTARSRTRSVDAAHS
jgi:hypothetical protein